MPSLGVEEAPVAVRHCWQLISQVCVRIESIGDQYHSMEIPYGMVESTGSILAVTRRKEEERPRARVYDGCCVRLHWKRHAFVSVSIPVMDHLNLCSNPLCLGYPP